MSSNLTLITRSRGHMDLRTWASHCKSTPCLVWCPRYSTYGNIMYLICHLTSHDHLIEGFWGFLSGLFDVFHHSLWSCGHKHCDSRDVFLIYHVISREHISKGVMWFYGWKLLTDSHHLAMFCDHWSTANGDIKYLLCHMTSQKHVIEG